MIVECKKCNKKDKMTNMNPLWNLFDPSYPPEYICKSCQPERLNPEDAILKSYYGNKFCCRCKEENCVCDSLNTTNK
jgi:hypothetical protein